jgi:hypothetical protein
MSVEGLRSVCVVEIQQLVDLVRFCVKDWAVSVTRSSALHSHTRLPQSTPRCL